MPVLVFAESREVRVAIGPVVEAAPAPRRRRPVRGRRRDESTGSSEAFTCARNRVNFNFSMWRTQRTLT